MNRESRLPEDCREGLPSAESDSNRKVTEVHLRADMGKGHGLSLYPYTGRHVTPYEGKMKKASYVAILPENGACHRIIFNESGTAE